jgi:hypothetical protein
MPSYKVHETYEALPLSKNWSWIGNLRGETSSEAVAFIPVCTELMHSVEHTEHMNAQTKTFTPYCTIA